jgi:uncharacterized repeat protein (TIGR03843 family)
MVQQWISIDPDVDIIAYGQGSTQDLRLMALFDAMINNTDRKFGHLLMDKSGRLFGCDHGVTFHVDDKLRTVLWQFAGDALSAAEQAVLMDAIETRKEIEAELKDHLEEDEIAALFTRIDRLLQDSSFPTPDDEWPSVPWPPV